jgi:hypothetical protein
MANQTAMPSENTLWSIIVYGSIFLLLVRVAQHLVGESNAALQALFGLLVTVLVLAVLAVGYHRLL